MERPDGVYTPSGRSQIRALYDLPWNSAPAEQKAAVVRAKPVAQKAAEAQMEPETARTQTTRKVHRDGKED